MIVIVAGMHRSGTSAMAGVLHNNGIIMGEHENKDFYPPPMRENPKGFFENVRFRRVNDTVLKKAGYSVKSFLPEIPVPDIDIHDRHSMRRLIEYYCGKYKDWGWKDPRTSLTMNGWLSVLSEMRLIKEVFILNMLRSPIDVANSMRLRGNKEHERQQFEALACAYHIKLLETMKVWQSSVGGYMEVFFNSLICDTDKQLAAVSSKIGKDIANNGFIEYNIARNIDGDTTRAREEVSTCV